MSDAYTDLNELKEKEALDQSIALNRIVLNMMESKRKEDFWLRIVLIISILANIVISCIFIGYESKFTTEKTITTTVTQDTGEGEGKRSEQPQQLREQGLVTQVQARVLQSLQERDLR